MVAKLPGELVDDLLEDDGVDVLAEHVEQEPVAHLGLLDDDVDTLLLDESEPDVEDVSLQGRSVRHVQSYLGELAVDMWQLIMINDESLPVFWGRTRSEFDREGQEM